MNNQGDSLLFNKNGEIDSDFWIDDDQEYSIKDFERRFSDFFDKRFVLIWMVTFIFHVSTALHFAINPPQPARNPAIKLFMFPIS